VEAIIRVFVDAGKSFVDEERQVESVCNFGRVEKCVVTIDAPVHLGPVENVVALGVFGGGV
jgi:hypothetical protein